MLVNRIRRCFATLTKYTKDHEWVRFDTQTSLAKVGITDHAQKELGDIVHVEFPKIGLTFKQHASIGAIESVKVAADIYAPVAGEIVAINENVKENPILINEDAENNWIITAKVTDPNQFDSLLDKEAYLLLLKH